MAARRSQEAKSPVGAELGHWVAQRWAPKVAVDTGGDNRGYEPALVSVHHRQMAWPNRHVVWRPFAERVVPISEVEDQFDRPDAAFFARRLGRIVGLVVSCRSASMLVDSPTSPTSPLRQTLLAPAARRWTTPLSGGGGPRARVL